MSARRKKKRKKPDATSGDYHRNTSERKGISSGGQIKLRNQKFGAVRRETRHRHRFVYLYMSLISEW